MRIGSYEQTSIEAKIINYKENDSLMIIKLENDVPLTDHINTICLRNSTELDLNECDSLNILSINKNGYYLLYVLYRCSL